MTMFPSARRALAAPIALLLALTLAVPLMGAKGANNSNAKACQKGGWMLFATSEDPYTAFADEEACVSYGAQGGTLTPLSIEECEAGGWEVLATSEYPFTAFSSQNDCVQYGIGGGTIAALLPPPTGKVGFIWSTSFYVCQVVIGVDGFDTLPGGAQVNIAGTLSNGLQRSGYGMAPTSGGFSDTRNSSQLPSAIGIWSSVGGTVLEATGSFTYNGVTAPFIVDLPAPCSTGSSWS